MTLLLLVACKDDSVQLVPGAATEPLYVHDHSRLYTWSPQEGLVEVGVFLDADGYAPGMVTDIAIGADGQLYMGASYDLYKVNALDATIVHASSLEDPSTGMTILPDGRLLVAGSQLTAIDVVTGVSEVMQLSAGYTTSGDVVAVPDGSVHWSVTGSYGDQWVRVDPDTGEAQLLGEVGASQLWGVAYADGELYAFGSNGAVYQVDATTGAGTLLVTESIAFYGATTNPVAW